MNLPNNPDTYTETMVFFYALDHIDLAVKFKPAYFSDQRLQRLFEILKPYILQYRETPSKEITMLLIEKSGYKTDLTSNIIDTLWNIKAQMRGFTDEWLNDCTKSYAEWNSFVAGVTRLYSYLLTTQAEVTVDTAHAYIEKAKQLFLDSTTFNLGNESLGHDFFSAPEHTVSVIDMVSTGYKFMDDCMLGSGALSKKQLICLLGGPKTGKSMWMANVCANTVREGKKCAYISLEMSVELVNKRFAANMLSIPINQYAKYATDQNLMAQKLHELRCSTLNMGELIIEEFPTSSLTPIQLETWLLNVEQAKTAETGKPWKFDIVYVDYVNIMASGRPGGNSADSYTKIKQICEDLRGIAVKNEWCIFSATQTNRGGMESSDLNLTNVSESTGLIMTVDALFGIISTSLMKAEGVYYLKALALRNSNKTGDKKKFVMSGDYMRITEDTTEDVIPEGFGIPEKYASYDENAKQGGYAKRFTGAGGGQRSQQPALQPQNSNEPRLSPPPQAPSLGVTEPKIQGFDLFNM